MGEYEDKIESLKSESPESNEVEFETSGEESSDPDEQSPSTRVKKVQSSKESRREARVLAYAENITDDEVIESINNTEIASKIKKVKSKRGNSHVHAAISKDSDFRREKIEILLLDIGAGVNQAGEDIIKDSGIKIYELKNERKVTEASGTVLDIIGVCELFVKLYKEKENQMFSFTRK